ncbi:phosphoadenylyl-sulfate reductase [Buchnera aphidicola (Mindarus keteleerifoliae)]|uniref:phosphoadenylyl-sulfate reductase n=1 Tax=Buchnera aphidicola TaxID=9 RepID=UPI0031B68BE8
MSILDFLEVQNWSSDQKNQYLKKNNVFLNKLSAENRIAWAFKNLSNKFVLSSSFGIQSVVLLHLVIQQKSDIPIIVIDTGYFFLETYKFIDLLTKKFNLNIKIYSASISPAWQESRYGKLWKKGIKGIEKYNSINKVKPMKYALKDLSVRTWIAGLRRKQSKSRNNLNYLEIKKDFFKFFPILDWSDFKIFNYIKDHNLPNHPLLNKGYISVGDVHTTSKYVKGTSKEKTRFFGLKRECGLHHIK